VDSSLQLKEPREAKKQYMVELFLIIEAVDHRKFSFARVNFNERKLTRKENNR
jgi:hypothetical protein